VRWARPGGVEQGLSDRFHEIWPDARKTVEATIGRFETVGARNPSCMLRLRDTARLSSEDCLAWSVTGPALRAAGTPMDLRRDAPYLAYGSVDFSVPVGERGDDYDRLVVVVEEIRQSMGIAGQCVARLAELGPGPLGVDDPRWSEVDLREEEVDGPVLPPGEVSVSVESSTGELGFLLVSDGQRLPRRIRCRAPSFFHAQAMPVILQGARLDDLLPTAALMHLVSGECDR
jgi:NADH:ubiquinone oxidoreductase subunit D